MNQNPMIEESLAVVEGELISSTAQHLMPALTIEQAINRFTALAQFVRQVMREGIDYGKIPGTDKPTLLKPGAEKLTTLFGLTKRFCVAEKIEDWTGREHDGEPFFYYSYRCSLLSGDILIAEADGSCNSWESKYRWRKADRLCPICQMPAIIKGKAEYGGGFICFKKKSGCGAKFADDDPMITNQVVGRVANQDICDQVNTIQKMSQKRALIAACLLAVNASEFFTQDLDDVPLHPAPEPASIGTPHPDDEEPEWGAPPSNNQTSPPRGAARVVPTEAPTTESDEERLERRASALVAMGQLRRDGDGFVFISGEKVARNDFGKVCCTCKWFSVGIANNPAYRCEHIRAVKITLTTEQGKVA